MPLNIEPPSFGDSGISRFMKDWLDKFRRSLATYSAAIPWGDVDKTGSNLTDIETRNHADLQNLNTASYTHLTAVNHTDLTDAGDTTLHYHSADRARANHTGTQLASTISDFTEAAQDAIGASIVDSASINFTYDDTANTITGVVLPAGIDHGGLSGLGDDDHTQYILANGTRAMTGPWDITVNSGSDALTITQSGSGEALTVIGTQVGDISVDDYIYIATGSPTIGIDISGAQYAVVYDYDVESDLPVGFSVQAGLRPTGTSASVGFQTTATHVPQGASLNVAYGNQANNRYDGSKTINFGRTFNAFTTLEDTFSGTVSKHTNFYSNGLTVGASTGSVTEFIGFEQSNETDTHDLVIAYSSQMTSDTGKWNFYASGNANNAYAGKSRYGSVLAPNATQDVLGTTRQVVGADVPSFVASKLITTETTPSGLFFRPDGLVCYYIGTVAAGTDNISQAALTTAWDISTMQTPSVAALATNPTDLWISQDGTRFFFVRAAAGPVAVVEYKTATIPWDISTLSTASVATPATVTETAPTGIALSDDGLNMYITGTGSNLVEWYVASTPYAFSGVSLAGSFSTGTTGCHGLDVSPCGTRLYLSQATTVRIYEFTTPFDVTTLVLLATLTTVNDAAVIGEASDESTFRGVYMKPDFEYMYLIGATHDKIYQYSTPIYESYTTGLLCHSGDKKVFGDTYQHGNLNLRSRSGLKVLTPAGAASHGWRDLLGTITIKGTGGGGVAANPDYVVYRGGLYTYRFGTIAPNNHLHEAFIEYHIPHDYVPGTDLYLHVHWSQTTVDTGGTAGVPGVAKWYFEVSYADGHGTPGGAADPFVAPITVSVTQQGSTTQYGHMIAEVQFTNNGGTGGLLNSNTIQVDGLVLVRVYRDPGDVADTLNQDTFVHFVDIHYQSNGMATLNKAPNFYE